jgi:hypothetical protein
VGSLLDPFADKVLVGALSLSMVWTGLLPWQLVALILGRDLTLVGGTFYHRLKTKDASSGFFDTADSGAFEVQPTLLSKVNTALQLSLFGFALTNAAWQIPGDQALHLLLYVASRSVPHAHSVLPLAHLLVPLNPQRRGRLHHVPLGLRVPVELRERDRRLQAAAQGGRAHQAFAPQVASASLQDVARPRPAASPQQYIIACSNECLSPVILASAA